MKEKYMKTSVWLQYFVALAVMTVNLAAHFLFLMSEAGWIKLHVGEWAQGWLVLYPFGWLVPLLWMLILSSLTGMMIKLPIYSASALPLTMQVGRIVLKALEKTWFHGALSWIFAVVQLILLIWLWREVIVRSRQNT